MKQVPRVENKRADELSNLAVKVKTVYDTYSLSFLDLEVYSTNNNSNPGRGHSSKLLKRKQISININLQQSSDNSDSDSDLENNLLSTDISDEKLQSKLHDFLIGFQSRRQLNRQHIRFNGTFMKLMLRDTERCDPMKLENYVKTIDIVQIIIPNEENRGKGLFKATLKFLMDEMKQLGHWKYLYIECINNDRLFKHVISRNDIIYREWNGQSVWVDLNNRTERIVETQQDLMNRVMQLPRAIPN